VSTPELRVADADRDRTVEQLRAAAAETGAGSFWPGWVLLGTGIAFAAFLIRFVLGVEE
jgi:hypothetical protein